MLRRSLVSLPLRRLSRPYTRPAYVSPDSASSLLRPPPPGSSSEEDDDPILPTAPASPAFFTGRAPYHDALDSLYAVLDSATRQLRLANIYPPPLAIDKTLTYYKPEWINPLELGEILRLNLRMTPYRRLVTVLDELSKVRAIARMAGFEDIDAQIGEALKPFDTRGGEEEVRKEREVYKKLDAYGRSYALGARKTSSARVWMIATRSDLPTARPPVLQDADVVEMEEAEEEDDGQRLKESLDRLFVAPTPPPSPLSPTSPPPPLPPTSFLISQILINEKPLPSYFHTTFDRELVVRPLRITGLLGGFNVFAIARGGGTTGQAHAVAHGIAKCIMSHAPQMKGVLTKSGLLLRDPRMVERKKTGQPKARARYTWVKR